MSKNQKIGWIILIGIVVGGLSLIIYKKLQPKPVVDDSSTVVNEQVELLKPDQVDKEAVKKAIKNGDLDKELDSIEEELKDIDTSLKDLEEPELDFNY